MDYQPIIIIGAPRSGTNMLRDVLCQFQKVGTWPCDEINYIWRHGNINIETDEFSVDMAQPKVKEFIRREFDNFAFDNDLSFLVEKTCANSLRVPFVDQVIPNAKYIFIVRDGFDVVGSASMRWKAQIDIHYLLKKVRYVPIYDLPYYGLKYISSHIYKFFSKEKRLSFWGPKFLGLDNALRNLSLKEVCAIQWKRCVDLSEQAFDKLPENQVIKIKYEEFVSSPVDVLRQVLNQLGVQYTDDQLKESVKNVSLKSIGKGHFMLNEFEMKAVTELISDTLNRHGYEY